MSTPVTTLRAALAAAEPGAVPVMARYADDPVAFAVEVLGITPWSRQADVLRAVAGHHRVAVRSGHKVGKSTTAAIVSLWWVCTRAASRVVLVAPTARQVRSILWREVRRLYRNALIPIGGELHDTPDRGLQFPDGRECIGFATDQPERIAGFSGPAMLFVVDEASGVTEDLYEAIAGNLAGGGRLLITGNPTRTSGTFFDTFNRKSVFWTGLHVSSLETPNASGDGVPIPGLATKEWADEMLAEWGEISPLYEVRVKGEFPSQAENAIISLEIVEAATARHRDAPKSGDAFVALGKLEIGLDPARMGGDESVAIARRGHVALAPNVWRNLDGVQLAAKVIALANDLRQHDETPVIRVDVIGIGASVYDQLRLNHTVSTIAVNVGESPSAPTYARRRDETWFVLRDWLKSGGAIPDDVKLTGELVAPTYSFTAAGKIQVESKDDMRARLKRSPDRADALALAVYVPARGILTLGDGPICSGHFRNEQPEQSNDEGMTGEEWAEQQDSDEEQQSTNRYTRRR